MIDPISLSAGVAPLAKSAVSGAFQAPSAFGTNFANPGVDVSGTLSGAKFSDMLVSTGKDMVHSLRHADSVAMDGMQGKAGTREVAEAVMSAEQSLQTAIAIRDKFISAYMEISRMAI